MTKLIEMFQAQQGSSNKSNGSTTNPQAKVTTTTPSTSPAGAATPNKPEPKPVECNLCHRKFKNIPALNGHMRLHGGYFKKVFCKHNFLIKTYSSINILLNIGCGK